MEVKSENLSETPRKSGSPFSAGCVRVVLTSFPPPLQNKLDEVLQLGSGTVSREAQERHLRRILRGP